jgi:transcriptional/translational regulatory protein YebC/TACO1
MCPIILTDLIVGGPDPGKNVRLAAAMEAASKANVLKKVIENAIRRGAGLGSDANKENVETAVYEGIGPGNVSFVV